jgi:hypothetical protein
MYTTDPDAERSFEAVGYRLGYPQRQTGIPMMVLPQYAKGTRDQDTNRARYQDVALAREMLAFSVLHNHLIWPTWIHRETVTNYWQAVEMPFGIGDAEFHGYWENGIETTADFIKVSYWKKNDREDYLVAVANWSDTETAAGFTLPPGIAGLAPGADMESGESAEPHADTGRFEVVIPRSDLRVLRFKGDQADANE